MSTQQWEYMVHLQHYAFLTLMDDTNNFGQQANELGDVGWELAASEVVMSHMVGDKAFAAVLYTFKRPRAS